MECSQERRNPEEDGGQRLGVKIRSRLFTVDSNPVSWEVSGKNKNSKDMIGVKI